MRCLLLCQGDGKRWERPDGSLPLGLPKHLVPDDTGEPVLHRTVRLLRERGVNDIIVVGPEDARYHCEGAARATLSNPFPTGTSMDKLFGTKPRVAR